jgi:hypothetical protein
MHAAIHVFLDGVSTANLIGPMRDSAAQMFFSGASATAALCGDPALYARLSALADDIGVRGCGEAFTDILMEP